MSTDQTNNPDDAQAGNLPPSPESIKFASQLKGWRLAKNMTQNELAVAAGVSKSSISMAERAFHHLPPKEITQIKIATALGITLIELREVDPGPIFHKMSPIKHIALTADSKGISRVAKSEYSQRDMGDLHLPAQWIRGHADDESVLRYYPVTDKSMQPTIDMGDIAILEPVGQAYPGLYLVGVADEEKVTGVGIRRVAKAADSISFSCDNKNFDPSTGDGYVLLSKVLLVIKSAFVPD